MERGFLDGIGLCDGTSLINSKYSQQPAGWRAGKTSAAAAGVGRLSRDSSGPQRQGSVSCFD